MSTAERKPFNQNLIEVIEQIQNGETVQVETGKVFYLLEFAEKKGKRFCWDIVTNGDSTQIQKR